MKHFLFCIVCVCFLYGANAQSMVRVQVGGYYQSFDNAQLSAFEEIQSEQFFVSPKIIYKAGFLYNRLLSILVANQQPDKNYPSPQIIVYPNPAKSVINFYLPPVYQVKQVAVFSVGGNLIYQATGAISKTINVSNLSGGFYVLSIILEDGSKVTARFMKL